MLGQKTQDRDRRWFCRHTHAAQFGVTTMSAGQMVWEKLSLKGREVGLSIQSQCDSINRKSGTFQKLSNLNSLNRSSQHTKELLLCSNATNKRDSYTTVCASLFFCVFVSSLT